MKFFHISDLHIGKQLYRYSLKDDQEYILQEIVDKVVENEPDALLISGDIYDKSVPSAEAVMIFDHFLTDLTSRTPKTSILLIAGNHDSAVRLDYARSILEKHSIHIAGMPPILTEEKIKKVVLQDDYGCVNFYLLPFLHSSWIRGIFPKEEIVNTDSAVRHLIEREQIDFTQRNVLMSHQFYTAGGHPLISSESEMLYVGGIGNVDASAVSDFDYVALGHIHCPQMIGNLEKIRYAGTPLKYSVSEQKQEKSITVVTLNKPGEKVIIDTISLRPLHDVREIRGTMEEVMKCNDDALRNSYISIVLTDEVDVIHPQERLREVYSHILEVRVDNARTRSIQEGKENEEETVFSTPMEEFEDFFRFIQKREWTEDEKELAEKVLEEIVG